MRKKPARMGATRHANVWVLAVLGGLVAVNLYVFVWDKKTSIAAIQERAENQPAMTINRPDGERIDFGSGSATPASAGSASAGVHNPGTITGKVAKSDTLGKLLKRNGLDPREADEVLRAVTPVFDVKTMRAGAAFTIERTTGGRVATFELELQHRERLRAVRDTSGTLVATVVVH
jgi:hypothetical protein